MENNTETITSNELIVIVEKSGLEATTAKSIQESMQPFFEETQRWKEKAFALVVTDVNQKAEMKMAGEARKALKAIRVSADKKRKELKEDSNRYGKAVQEVYNFIEAQIEPIETHLELQEKFAEIEAEKEKQRIKSERLEKLMPYDVAVNSDLIAAMDESMWLNYFNGVVKTHEDRIEAEKQAELERLENERLDKLENERRIEVAPFAQFITTNSDLRIMSDEDYTNLLNALKAAKSEHEAEQKRIAKENEDKLRAANIAAAKAAKELQDKKDAELKAQQDAEAAAELEASKGEPEKLQSLIADLEALKTKYTFKSKKYKTLHSASVEMLDRHINYLISKQ